MNVARRTRSGTERRKRHTRPGLAELRMTFELLFPRTMEEAWDLLASGPAGSTLPIAGGTDLLMAVEFGRWAPARLVSLSRLPLGSLRRSDHEWVIGSNLPLCELERDPSVRRDLPALYEAVREVGSVQLRHRATLGGNLGRASSASDLLPPLLALEAHVTLSSRTGRRSLPVSEFILGPWQTALRPGELIEQVVVPAPRPGTYRWQRVRPANDISQVGVAVVLHPAGNASTGSPWRIVAGGTHPSVQRLIRAEACLTGAEPTEPEVERASRMAGEEAMFATDLRAAEEYRRHLVQVLVRRAVTDVARAGDGGPGA
jgi:aerobic carbon-monoxide dehydrogenase medium subunit